MKLLNFVENGKVKLGLKLEGGILDVEKAGLSMTMEEAIAGGKAALEKLAALPAGELLDEAKITFAPAVTNPPKILCVGLNYADHVAESNQQLPEHPVIFSKFNNALAAHREAFPTRPISVHYDYEGELVIVMGKGGRDIPKEDALSYVFGYTCGDDISVRDLQMRTSQWLLGKTWDKAGPVGPYIATADSLDCTNLDIKTLRNGQVVQHSNTKHFIFDCATVISYLSRYITLEAGDIIFTGTPDGVIGMGDPSQKNYLKAGDKIEVCIEGIGTLENILA